MEPLLSLYADGAVSPIEAERAKAHLADCEDCRRHYQWIIETSRTLALRPIVSPPADLSVRIAQAIAAEDARTRQFVTRRPLVLRTVYATAASLMVVAALAAHSYFGPHALPPQTNIVASQPPVTAPAIHPLSVPVVKSGKPTEKMAMKPTAVHALHTAKPNISNTPEMTASNQPESVHPKLHPAIVREIMPPVQTAKATEANTHQSVLGTHPAIHHPVKSIVGTHQQELVAKVPKNTENNTPSTSAPTLPAQPTATPAPTAVAAVPTEPTAKMQTASMDTNSMLRSRIPPPQMVSGKVSGSPLGSVHMASAYGTDSFDNGVSNRSGTGPTVHSQ